MIDMKKDNLERKPRWVNLTRESGEMAMPPQLEVLATTQGLCVVEIRWHKLNRSNLILTTQEIRELAKMAGLEVKGEVGK